MATKAEVQQAEERLKADLEILAGQLLKLTERLEAMVARRHRRIEPHTPTVNFRAANALPAAAACSSESVHVECLADVPQADLSKFLRSEVMLMSLEDACSSVGT